MTPLIEVLEQAGHRGPLEDPVQTFVHHLSRKSSGRAKQLAREFYHAAALSGHPLHWQGTTTFLFHAPRAREVYLAGEFNGWHGNLERMQPLGRTGLFVLRRPVHERATYKFVVDGRWKPDPANALSHPDGHGGHNSVFRTMGSRLLSHPGLYSKTLRNRRSPVIYLPPGYDASQARYPVVYIMDGDENLHRGQLPALFDAEIHAGRLPPLIGVFIPHNKNRDREYTPYFRNSRLDAFHRFMAFEMVPLIDRAFRTRAEPDGRTLLGQSFGGTVVSSLAVRAPHIFRHVLAQSGVFTWSRNRTILPLFEQSPARDLRFYLDCVANRFERAQSQQLARLLAGRGYPHFFRAIPSRHEYEDWRERVADGLRYLWFDVAP